MVHCGSGTRWATVSGAHASGVTDYPIIAATPLPGSAPSAMWLACLLGILDPGADPHGPARYA